MYVGLLVSSTAVVRARKTALLFHRYQSVVVALDDLNALRRGDTLSALKDLADPKNVSVL